MITEEPASYARASSSSDATPGHQPGGTPATVLPSPNPSGSFAAGHVAGPPVLPKFDFRARPPAFNMFGMLRACPDAENSARAASRHLGAAPPPCLSADLALRLPAPRLPAPRLLVDAPDRDDRGVRADDDYKTFKPDPSPFDGSLFPDKVPSGNGALKKWIFGLFR